MYTSRSTPLPTLPRTRPSVLKSTVRLGVKKNLLFLAYFLFNVALAIILLLIERGYLIVAFVILVGHARDVVSILYQILNMKKILARQEDIDPGVEKVVYCLVPVYNEDEELVEKNLKSLTSQNLPETVALVIAIVFDGVTDQNRPLLKHIDRMIDYDEEQPIGEYVYENWKRKVVTKATYRTGTFKGKTIVVCCKDGNFGKKDSLLLGEEFINDIHENDPRKSTRSGFIYHTDGDTISDENCLPEMVKHLVANEDIDGVSGLLRAYEREGASLTDKCFVYMQDFQYFYSLIVRRQTESLLKSTVCLPGCANMIRMNEKTSAAMEKYRRLPVDGESLLQASTRMQGTDRRYTTLLLKQGLNVQMNWRAFVYTEPPLNPKAFIRQRRRWSSNSFFNSIVMLYSENIPVYIRVSAFVDVCKLFGTIFRFISYFCFWIFLDDFSTFNIVMSSVFIAFPYIYSFVWIFLVIDQWVSMSAGFLLSKIFMPFLSVLSVTNMFMTSNNFDWGVKRVASTDVEQPGILSGKGASAFQGRFAV